MGIQRRDPRSVSCRLDKLRPTIYSVPVCASVNKTPCLAVWKEAEISPRRENKTRILFSIYWVLYSLAGLQFLPRTLSLGVCRSHISLFFFFLPATAVDVTCQMDEHTFRLLKSQQSFYLERGQTIYVYNRNSLPSVQVIPTPGSFHLFILFAFF